MQQAGDVKDYSVHPATPITFGGEVEDSLAPLPRLPLMHGSSQKCSAARATFISRPQPQEPALFRLSAPHRRGHSSHKPSKPFTPLLLYRDIVPHHSCGLRQ